MPWALLVAQRGPGRSDRVRSVVDALRRRGVVVRGFLQAPGDAPGTQMLERLDDGRRLFLARPAPAAAPEGQEIFCGYCFELSAFDVARTWIEQAGGAAGVVLADELGKLEAAGRGHLGAVAAVLSRSVSPVIVSVRADVLPAVLERLETREDPLAALEPDDGPAALETFADGVAAAAAT